MVAAAATPAVDVLIVDDDDDIRLVLGEVLSEEGYRAVGVANGAEAVTFLRQVARPPCLVILDLMMPIVSGWDFLAMREHDPVLAGVPVVVVSGTTILQHTQMPPVDEKLAKPFHVEELLATVHRYCSVGLSGAGRTDCPR